MLKMEKEYNEKFGDISLDSEERINYLFENTNLSRCKLDFYAEKDRIENIKWTTLKYTMYILPKGTPRPRLGKHKIFYVAGANDNKKFFKNHYKEYINEDITLIKTPCKFKCISYLPIPKSMSPVEKILAELGYGYAVSKPDWDNLAKAYCDMIQDTLLYDDSLIIDGRSIKKYSIKPRVEVEISYMNEYDLKYNEKKFITKGLM